MENLLLKYQHPNIIDIKLGTQLHDGNVDEFKKYKMEVMSRISTSEQYGLLISAVQVYDRQKQITHKINKNYGMFMLGEYFPKALISFFYNIVEPLYNDSECPKEDELDSSFYESEPSDYVAGFLKAILIQVKELQEAVSQSHVAIYGSSLCIIYETINIAKEVEKRCKNPDTYEYPFSLHYIDFAHAYLVDQGVDDDKSLMTGFNTFISIIEKYLNSYNKI
ncbi:hypothetical protein PIROE2DRAFT_4594 [Piromyces sp. E2]|nr:hypothetical protein PIROE2DRAFT_4594 [Piromyces sp. E2]|eukprot:OUM67788.1 hypothetical protein PIROE2DRAFT_4594 [Piromyces sp. E2]